MTRLVDQDRSVPMRDLRVCCVGLPKTGNASLLDALTKLGYRVYHGFDAEHSGRRDMDLLNEALEIKAKGGADARPYRRKEFDKIWGEYNAIIGLPGFAFVDELIEAYPNALFILTERNVDDWHRDMQEDVFAEVDSWSLFCESLYDSWHARPFQRLLNTWCQMFCQGKFGNGAKEAYMDHVMHCKKAVPPERLLTLRLEDQEGWQPLCKFLKKRIPNEPYPDGDGEHEGRRN
ncbi:uncharacterized protein MYCFIDRAFT_43766 [Pseudocercospora fijiensis CIRAD86]|uniref:P-loop containing nucleoside triphosphate hydrolase protein n=1 Tax=Pseudocercospora fijiensis (strain CIRAD86) TaxID=383855 RepID=N1Q9I3_PSEFD|nr:uncharacterized protein MYCFIDRAFT_43766 [Pseudocercospora fijiensis CIRAD86]EME88456.1 hypothetical protein MYCFIDRAFT_43766 [Pseudocercospora fijiensis CIRAD86]